MVANGDRNKKWLGTIATLATVLFATAGASAQQCGRIDFGVTPDDNGNDHSCANGPSAINTHYVNTQSIVFGTALDKPNTPPVRVANDNNGACAPACRSAGGVAGFSTDWWCQFKLGTGPQQPGVIAVVPWFSAELCFIDSAPGTILMEAYNNQCQLIATAQNTQNQAETLTVTATGDDMIAYVRVLSSVKPNNNGLSIDCLDYPNPERKLSCGSDDAGDCFEPHDDPFCEEEDCCQDVCEHRPDCCDEEWDEGCASEAHDQCEDDGPCEDGDGDCLEEHDDEACDNEDCCREVCEEDPYCCIEDWDDDCVEIALDECLEDCGEASGPCCDVHDGPTCDVEVCCDSVCEDNPRCCYDDWDEDCVELAFELCSGNDNGNGNGNGPMICCGSPMAGNCYNPHGPGAPACENKECCELICGIDPFCCSDTWDQLCADEALAQCGQCGNEDAGDCFGGTGSPGCDEFLICQTICEIDAYCCHVEWDTICADQASARFSMVCPGKGDCFDPNGSPGCNDEACCSLVCEDDPACCAMAWDEDCADAAVENCGSPATQACPCDIDHDGIVGLTDLTAVILGQGCKNPPGPCLGNVNGDDIVDIRDFVELITEWGPCQ